MVGEQSKRDDRRGDLHNRTHYLMMYVYTCKEKNNVANRLKTKVHCATVRVHVHVQIHANYMYMYIPTTGNVYIHVHVQIHANDMYMYIHTTGMCTCT